MKFKLYTGLGLVIVGAVILSVGQTAQAANTVPALASPGSSFDQRLVQRKQERAVTLAPLDQTRLTDTCFGAQGKLSALEVNYVPTLANRIKVYQQIDAKILVTIGQLKLAGKDTFALEKDRLALVDKISAFQVSGANFTQSLDDTEIINCKADIVGFKALLETAQLYYASIQSQAVSIHDLIVNVVKPELASHTSDLQPKTPNSGSN